MKLKIKRSVLPALLFMVLFMTVKPIFASDARLNISIAGEDSSACSEMISLLSKSPYMQIIERKDLGPLFKELELKQTGVVYGVTDSRIKGIDYIIFIDKNQYKYNFRIVKVDTGDVIFGDSGFIQAIADKCLERLETEVALRNYRELDNDKGLRVEIRFRKDSYRVGELISFYVTSHDSEGYLYLVDYEPDGSIVVLRPLQQKTPFEIKAGQRILVPDDLGFNIRAVEPAGRDTVVAIVTKKPIDITKFGLNAGEALAQARGAKKMELSRGMMVELKQLPLEDWGKGLADITIENK